MTTSASFSRGDLSLERGFVFCPLESELTDVYLHRKINDVPLPADAIFINAADVYSAEPEKLMELFDKAPGTGEGGEHKQPVWYFFSPVHYVRDRKTNARGEPGRKSRTINGDAGKRWHSEKGEMPVNGGSKYGGYQQYFSYKAKNESSGRDERAGWVMWEYGISPEHGGGDLVLCKINRSSRTMPSKALTTDAEPVPDPTVSSNKRKAPDGNRPEDAMASARPRHTDEHEEHPMPVESLESHFTSVLDEEDFPQLLDRPAAEEPEWYGAASLSDHQYTDQTAPSGIFFQNNMVMPLGDLPMPPRAPEDNAAMQPGLLQTVTADEQNYNDDLGEKQPLLVEGIESDETFRPEDLMADFQMNFPELFGSEQVIQEPDMYGAADFADHQPTDQAVPPCNFFQNVEQDFWSLYQNDNLVIPVGDLAMPPCASAAAAQPEEDDAAGLLQTDEVPPQNYNHDGQMCASLGEEQPEPDKTASDEAIYGLPCPAFSPEMIERCKDDLMMPWKSHSSMYA